MIATPKKNLCNYGHEKTSPFSPVSIPVWLVLQFDHLFEVVSHPQKFEPQCQTKQKLNENWTKQEQTEQQETEFNKHRAIDTDIYII